MRDTLDRPDPDALLRRVQEEEARAARGKLKIFFGFAPGVGKTYRMLAVARDLVNNQHLDLVVGLVETHGRPETAALLSGLELLPKRRVEYRGRTLEEFDLDAALARRPKILLVDELAHTNAPGSRHSKRWQDILELLNAGIHVFTTVNVQHIESLNDIIAQITRISVRETVPDAILDQADEIELLDIAPEELLQRLREGKVYLPDQAQRAVEHFFKRGNLLSLRELALRRTAQHVDEDVREYREEHGVSVTWPAGERILVCVGPAPSSSRLIRASARMAAGLRCPWSAVYVDTPATGGMSEANKERLEAHFRLAESLGATVTRLSGGSVAPTLLAHARRQNVTRIIIGKPTHSRLRDRLRGSLLDEMVRGSADIDVHVIRGDVDGPASGSPEDAPASTPPFKPLPYALSFALVLLTTALATAIRALFPLPDLEVLYLLAVMIAAIHLGRGPATFAAALGVAAYDFFFVPPFYTFAVADGRYFLSFAMMFGIGFVVSELVARLRDQEQQARAREQRTAALYALSRDLGNASNALPIASAVATHASLAFEAEVCVVRADETGSPQALAASPSEFTLDSKAIAVVKWCLAQRQWAGLGTDTLPGASVLCLPLGAAHALALVLKPHHPSPLRSEQRAFLDAFCRQAGLAFERARLYEEARVSALRAKSEEMRSSLLSALSHDLRTPLASVTGAATSLKNDKELSESTKAELLDSICDEAERLERLVANLLDMTRLESGGMIPKREWVPLEEIIGSALNRLESRLGKRPIAIDLEPDLPLLSIDPLLFEQVLVNLLENACKYTPPISPIEIRAGHKDKTLTLSILDRGPGLEPGAIAKIFEKFFRGPHSGISGAGLGLAICRGIIEAHEGSIQAFNRPDGGAEFRILLPIVGIPPPIDAALEAKS